MENKKICKNCDREVEELFGLFVPHLCKNCYEIKKRVQIENGEICSICKEPYISCSC